MRAALLRSWALRLAGALLLAYLVLGWLFARETETGTVGLFDPTGHPNYFVLGLGVFYLVARIATRLLVPALVVVFVVDQLALRLSWPSRRAGRG